MTDTWWIFWFLGDPVFWEWARPLGAAALGAGATAFLSSRAQNHQFRLQLKSQEKQWTDERGAKVVDDSMADARQLIEDFMTVHREVQEHERIAGEPFAEAWPKIWTTERSLKIDVTSEFIIDARTRSEIARIVQILDNADDITSGSWSGRSPLGLRGLALNVTSAAITELGSYIRHGERSTDADAQLDKLDQIRRDYDDYVDVEVARAEHAAEALEEERFEEERHLQERLEQQRIEDEAPNDPEADGPEDSPATARS